MDAPKTVRAVWERQYLVGSCFKGSSRFPIIGQGYYPAGTLVTLRVDPTKVETTPGTRYVFDGWSGASNSTNPTISVEVSGPFCVGTVDHLEYRLTVLPATNTAGAGWYREGTEATVTAEITIGVSAGERQRFLRWTGDASGTLATVHLLMNAPHTVQAEWQQQYLVTVDPGPGVVSGDGWVDAGSAATLIAAATAEDGGVAYEFLGWSDGATERIRTVTVTAPLTIDAVYRALDVKPAVDLGPLTFVILLVLIVLVLLFALWRRRRPKPEENPVPAEKPA